MKSIPGCIGKSHGSVQFEWAGFIIPINSVPKSEMRVLFPPLVGLTRFHTWAIAQMNQPCVQAVRLNGIHHTLGLWYVYVFGCASHGIALHSSTLPNRHSFCCWRWNWFWRIVWSENAAVVPPLKGNSANLCMKISIRVSHVRALPNYNTVLLRLLGSDDVIRGYRASVLDTIRGNLWPGL